MTASNAPGDLVILRTKAGRIHKGFERDGVRYTDERCQLDDAPGKERVITFAELEHADRRDICQWCWPADTETPA